MVWSSNFSLTVDSLNSGLKTRSLRESTVIQKKTLKNQSLNNLKRKNCTIFNKTKRTIKRPCLNAKTGVTICGHLQLPFLRQLLRFDCGKRCTGHSRLPLDSHLLCDMDSGAVVEFAGSVFVGAWKLNFD
jgi:hypothetical protein